MAEFRDDERVPVEHRSRIDTMEAKASAVKEKLPEEEGSVWDAIRHEIRRDLDALGEEFEHAVKYIDEHYRERK